MKPEVAKETLWIFDKTLEGMGGFALERNSDWVLSL